MDNAPNLPWRRRDDHDVTARTRSATGAWSYTLDNGNAAVQALNAGATLTDHITVTTVDGTTQVVTVTINGTDDFIETAGNTGLAQVVNRYFLRDSGGNGPTVKYQAAA